MTETLLKKVIKNIKNPYIVISKIIEGRAKFLSDKNYLNIHYRASFKKNIDWNNPSSFNEKLQWLKVYDRKDIYSKLVDKYEVRNIIKSKIGEDYLIPLLGVWESFDEINFDNLPNQFVLKCTHDSGSVIICKDKTKFDRERAKKKINEWMSINYYWKKREWPYINIKPRIIAEELMLDESSQELKDYKFFTFNGEPRFLYIASDRNKENEDVKFDYFDIDFQRINVRQSAHENSNYIFSKPEKFEEMIEISKILSKGIPQVRMDFYVVNGKIYFGEYTFFHHSGLVPFIPESFDYVLGDLIKLEKNS